MLPSDQGVRQGSQNPLRFAVVNMRVGPIEIAQRLRQPVRLFLERELLVTRAPLGSHSQAQLEWHVEPWRRWRIAVQADPAEVVERIPARAQQRDDPVQPPLASGQLDGRMRRQAERTETSDERKIEALV